MVLTLKLSVLLIISSSSELEIPISKRARFMNNILPLFYKSMYPFCKNAREFVKRFHDQGRHEYDAECGLERLENGSRY